jgi:hypothetical protein
MSARFLPDFFHFPGLRCDARTLVDLPSELRQRLDAGASKQPVGLFIRRKGLPAGGRLRQRSEGFLRIPGFLNES